MKKYLILILALLPLTGCPQAGSLFTPGSFDANKTTAGGEKSKEGSDGTDSIDKIVSTDVPPPPPTSAPPPGSPPEAIGNLPPAGGDAAQGSGSEHEMMMAFQGPIDPKNDGERVNPSFVKYRLRYGPGPEDILTEDGNTYPLFLNRRAAATLKFLLEVNINKKGWRPADDGGGVRLIFIAEGKTDSDAKCIDAVVKNDAALEENVSFLNLSVGAGQIFFYEGTGLSGCGGPGLSDFGAAYPAFAADTDNHPYLGTMFIVSPRLGIPLSGP